MSPKNSAHLHVPHLKEGASIGVVSPGRWPKPEWIEKGKVVLEKHGFSVVVHAQNSLKDGQLAGPDAARAQAIMDMFKDPAIDAVICARGGTGSIKLLELLDYEVIGRNPKPFIGFSDITYLLQAITKRAGFATYHGPILWNLAQDDSDPRIMEDLIALTSGKPVTRHYREAECVRQGQAEGRLIGGNMSMLQHLIGTPFDWTGEDAILFIEDCDEVIYKLAERLWHMRLAGKFAGVRAVLVGEMIDIADGETGFAKNTEKPYGRSLRDVFLDALPRHVPLCFNFPCGHGRYITTLPLGRPAKMTFGGRGVELVLSGG